MTEETATDLKTCSYEQNLEELTQLVDEVGRVDCPVDMLEKKVRRAVDLIRSLRERLSNTEMTVKEVLDELQGDAVDQA